MKNGYTVCAALNKKKDEIFAAINKGDTAEAKRIAYECLEDPKITDQEAAGKARVAFSHPNTNHFYSTLMTYMTCMKAQ